MLTRVGCHLCESAEREVAAIAEPAGVSVELIDLDRCDPEVRAAWTDHVPVTVVDGRVVGIWVVNAETVRSALTEVTHNRMRNTPGSDHPPTGGGAHRGAEGSGR